jgi:hypothetical protein
LRVRHGNVQTSASNGFNMKIKPEHASYMASLIVKADTEFHRSRYIAAGLSDMRYRWDLVRHVGLIPWICDNLYTYANDDHINTVLRKLIPSLEGK